MGERKSRVYSGGPPGKTGKKRTGNTQTVSWRAVLSEGVMTARLFFTFSAVAKAGELHNRSPPGVLHFKK